MAQPRRQRVSRPVPFVHLAAAAGLLGLIALGSTDSVLAQEGGTGASVDKWQYHLFNPTPRDQMRDLAADRPDATESPITVDAGHVQVEMSFIDYTHDDEDGEEVDAWAFADTNIKVGLLNNVDMQIVFAAYGDERVKVDETPDAEAFVENETGFSDVQLRFKVNLWGNDPVPGQTTAFGIMPFIKIPTGAGLSNGHAEGGVIAMFGWDVAETWGLGFQVELDAVYDEEDDDTDLEFAHTAVLGFDVVGPLGAYIEYLGVLPSESASQYQASFSGGVTLEITRDLRLDAGLRAGLTDDADDLVLFTDMTVRF